MMPPHESFLQQHIVLAADGDHLFRLGDRHRQGFFTQHMLARSRRRQRPSVMLFAGCWNVDGIDIWIGKHRFVAVVGSRTSALRRELCGNSGTKARQSREFPSLRLLNSRDQAAAGDTPATQDAEAEWCSHEGRCG